MVGQTIGSYKIVDKIGEGGMGAVYRGEHVQIGREVAIKVLLAELTDNANIVQRFFNEAKAATAIKHPGIVEVYDFGHTPQGSPYIVMEFLEGEPLQKRLERENKLPPKVAIDILHQIASALGAAHQEGIVHRDLKPDNVHLIPDPMSEIGVRAKLLDFGIAKLDAELRGGLDPTRAGAVLGTPQYMSPEQCTGSTSLDHRSDMYSLGCVMFHMLCGRPPFEEQEFGRLAIKHLSAPPPNPTELEPAVSPELEKIVLRLLEKTPDDRFQSCGQLLSAMDGKPERPATPVPMPTALPPGARTYVPGEVMMMAKDIPANQAKTPAPSSAPSSAPPPKKRKTAFLDPAAANSGVSTPAGPSSAPQKTPVPASAPGPQSGNTFASEPEKIQPVALAIIGAVIIAFIVVAVLLAD